MITITLTGIAEVTQQLQRLIPAPIAPLSDALYAEGNSIMGQSVQLVPVLTGNLRSTAHVERPVTAGSRVEVELSYGKHGDAEYAAIVHNDPTMNHPHGGQSHYLQAAIFSATAGFTNRMADSLKGTLTI